MRRRLFVAAAGVAALQSAPGFVYLTAEEAAIVESLCDAIIPSDQDPGAAEAHVVRYIDHQLGGPLKRYQKRYRDQLPRFAALVRMDTAARTRFLEALGPDSFFDMVIDHTMQGFYGDPKYGGNANAASWKMMGIEKMMGHHG